ncbi:hypothetical protein MesoLjLc_45740 [Mesorhizobium sp. L-8-10]|uniref:DUF6950 family protein n=1 Tax=Mesorhizobium sp. L-8-10 TaxID=2744523 RepID=UPI001926B6DE|nr:hypothetical protein [Mesorhizobium sp. L-8-10]BCH32644.1 hypothetical protein MesoLjLc_45740 [Mesorhizobium sp. L-8-10]
MTIDEFIRAEAALPGYPGACCRMADKWVTRVTGFSALARFGRDFRTDEDVRAWLAEPGGLAVAVNRVMRAGGFAKTRDPQAGDVGLIVHAGRLCMAIHAGSVWVSRDDSGMIGAPLGAGWKAWRVA